MSGGALVGGFTGIRLIGDYARNWSSGAISASGVVGGFSGSAISGGAEYIYWNEDTSGLTASTAAGEAAVVQTLVASNFGGGESSAWAGLDDNADFPLLTVHSRPWQAVNLASALTRVLLVNDGGANEAAGIDLATANEIRLDTNGLAPDTGIGGTSIPTCEFVNGELRAQTNYNGVMVKLTMMTGGPEAFAARSGCEVGFQNVTGEFAATLRLEISAPAIGDDLARSLTTDYALRITMDSDTAARDEFVRMIEAGGFDWFAASLTVAGGNPGDWDNDGNQNRYDWTPTSISVGGVLTQVDLLLGEERNRGTATNPWPIYNVWQLQAIDGIRVDAGVPTGDFNLFGSTVARLGSHYRLAVDIDATPTRDWQTIGFNPIGVEDNNITTNFIGAFDGEGREIRGLFMNSSDANAALFDHVGTGGRVSRVGLRDMEVRVRDGGNRAAGAVARLDGGTVSLVWASGTVQGALFNNAGLVGYLESGELRESWFVGDIEGNGGNGGLVGLMATGEIADSWAMAEVRQIGDNQPNGGLIGRANGGALTTSWSGGPVADGDNSGGIIGKPTTDDSVLAGDAIYLDTSTSGESKAKANNVAASISLVETMVTVNSGLGAAWFYGRDSDTNYPFLREFDAGLQAAYFANFQTRILPGFGGEELPTAGRTPMGIDEVITLTLDSNGLATGAATPNPTCADTDAAGVRVAKTNYNDVMVRLRATGEGSAEFTEDCKILVRLTDDDATLVAVEALIVSGEETISNWTHSFELDAERVFLYEIATGARQWRGDGDADDWDGDGVANPYDWTPTSVTIGGVEIEVNLNMSDADGSEGNPYPIYNVWQLQAIDGVSVSSQGDVDGNVTLSLFGDDAAARLGAQYRLAMDIDAAPTKEWDSDAGFNPIGGSFTGLLNGDGFAVRDLFIDRSGNEIGLFREISNVLAVWNMGVEDADIRGGANIGIIAGGLSGGSIGRVWTTGKVVGSGNSVGGLVGFSFNTDQSTVMMSWSTADVRGANGVGGLIGQNSADPNSTDFSDNWAGGDVNGGTTAAGLVGISNRGAFTRNWSSGAISGGARAGFVGGGANNSYSGAYWNLDTSGVSNSAGAGVSVVVQTLAASDFGGEAAAAAWAGLDDNADFPLLADLSRPWQAVNLARVLTRIFGVDDAAMTEAAAVMTLTTNGLRLDTNGLAADTGSGGTSKPTCAVVGGELLAQTNYNGVAVKLALVTDGSQEMVAVARTNTHCEVGFANAENEFAATLRLEISAPSLGDDAARVLATDYALRIAPDLSAEARDDFVRAIGGGDFDWFSDALIVGSGSSGDWDGDGIANVYDWTPTSIEVRGEPTGVNLTLSGAPDGTADNRWPVYNIWQLQAIDGVVPVDATAGLSPDAASASRTAGLNLYGGNPARRRAFYRMAVDIDATPTRNWDGGRGFNPIGSSNTSAFNGDFDGGGNVVRGLYIDRAGQNYIGLFAYIETRTENPNIANLGLDGARIRGGDRVGAIAGGTGNVVALRGLWARGRVQGGDFVGGLIGDGAAAGFFLESWFAGQVEGDNNVGGLAGSASPSSFSENWAAVDIVAPAGARAGELAGRTTGAIVLRRAWGEGYLSASSRASIGNNRVYYDNIRALEHSAFQSNSAWVVGRGGADGDFPILTPHSVAIQGAAIAYGLTRASVFGGRALLGGRPGFVGASPTIVFDLNGDADDRALSCGVGDSIATGYNGATVSVSLPAGAVAAAGVCGYVLAGFDSGGMTLTVSFSAGGDSIAREYPLVSDAARLAFLAEIETADDWFSAARIVAGVGSAGDWDGDGIANVYDWTPIPDVNLTSHFTGAGGAAENPWPIYNIWQLQAIDGVVPADATMGLSSQAASASETAGQNLFGDSSSARGATYLLARNIDATPTGAWNGARGFNPIGNDGNTPFYGAFDGGGNVVRGLRIFRTTENIGLFARISRPSFANPPPRVVNLGLDDVRIRGGNNVGAIAGLTGNQDTELRAVWARGRVQGRNDVGGLVGFFGTRLFDSWFAGRVEGNIAVGGLVGNAFVAENIRDSWAAVDIVAPADALAGELVGDATSSTFRRLWGEGYLSANSRAPLGGSSFVHHNDIRALGHASFESNPIWKVGRTGASGDFPILTSHSESTQAAAIAYGLTRASVFGELALGGNQTRITYASPTIVFDLNGDAADPASVCDANADGTIATGYNGATVSVSFPTGVTPAVGVCGYVLTGFDSDSLRLKVSFLAGGDSIARDYLLVSAAGRRSFLAQMAADPARWLDDDDNDNTINAYDWTPSATDDFDLRDIDGARANGARNRPYPIYNIWQLQAIEGVVPAEATTGLSSDAASASQTAGQNLFGATPDDRLDLSYRMQFDIDATRTRNWDDGKGFTPIGFSSFSDFFSGVFDGGGNVVRGLHIDRPESGGLGLFSAVRGTTSATARIANLGVDDARISGGNQSIGAIIGFAQNEIELESVWARGRVRGGDDAVGGLVGRTSFTGANRKFDMDSSWFAGRVAGGDFVGGLVGDAQGAADVELTDSWAAADIVASDGTAGELAGRSIGDALLRSWGDGYLSANATVSHTDEQSTYYDGILTLTLAAFENEPIWNVGTNSDFPILTVNSAATQGAAIAYGLTRVSVVGGRVLSEEQPTLVSDSLTIAFDLNGDAADSDPVCVASVGEAIPTGYNNATISVSLPTGAVAAAGVCGYVLPAFDSGRMTLTVSFASGGDSITREYPMQINDAQAFLAEIETADDWFSAARIVAGVGSAGDWDGDGIANVYDWTPIPGVNLTSHLIGAGGAAENPWPIYNIWQLQAIDGVVPADATMGLSSQAASASQTAGENLYGADSNARLGANYLLALDIDATPTRNWDDGSGFDPIGAFSVGNRFGGLFDGGGNIVRGLHIDRASNNIGLFAAVAGGAEWVVNLGLDDARITGGNSVGAIAGVVVQTSEARAVWARGRVRGGDNVGGLIGASSGGILSEGWFAGRVEGNNSVGGLVGEASFSPDLIDSWAAVDIVAPAGARAGELVGNGNSFGISNLTRMWGEGYLSAADFLASGANLSFVHTDNIRALDDDDFDDAPAWNVGSVGADGDFPTLTVHSAATQGAAIAYGLTRISLVGGRVLSEEDPTLVSDLSPTIVFDRNGDAADRACVAGANGAIATGYNDATVRVSLPTGAVAAAGGVCGYVLTGFDSGEMTLTVSFLAGGDSIAREYPLAIDKTQAFIGDIAGDFDWFSPDLTVAGGTPIDWDNDGINNPYDWTPLPGVDLLIDLTDPGSSASNPWPIYNVWQLQAIDGVSVSQDGSIGSSALFGGESARLGANYRLQMDIDATPTRAWDSGKGFNSIGFFGFIGDDFMERIFTGGFDGGGNVVRGLFIGRGDLHTGLFAYVTGSVVSLGLDDVYVSGGTDGDVGFGSGALVGGLVRGGLVSESWARGEVIGSGTAGGLVGALANVSGGGAATVSASWFAGRVVSSAGDFGLAGGLLGHMDSNSAVVDNWAVSDIAIASGNNDAHEIVSDYISGSLTRSWGEAFWLADDIGREDDISSSDETQTYYSNLRGLNHANFGSAAIWNVGTSSDYPVLTSNSRNLQAAALAAGLSRVVGINGATVAATRQREITNGKLAGRFESMRIERINGDIPAPDCSFSDGALRAQMGYNMATAIITLIAPDAELAQRGGPDSCEINLINNNGGDATLRFVYASRIDPAAPEARLTTDYDLTIARDTAALARTEFAEEIAAGDFNWFAARNSNPAHDWDDDGIANPYDWTPTSITIMVDGAEVEVGVNLTVNGVDPWPIYNVWQLQAIDGLSVSEAGVTTGGFELFGDMPTRLAANYRLAMNIDATPTESWQSGIGFDPIGDTFTGSLDGEGREIRGLHINKSDENGGLFNVIGTGGRVSRLGLPDIDVRASGFRSAGLAAHLNGGTVRLVWASGTAQGAISNNAGLIGYLESGDLRESWFVGDIVGGGGNGGLVGLIATEGEIADSWAMARVRQTIANQPNGGLIGRANGGVLTTSWSGGPVADGDNSGGIIGKPTTDDSALAGGAIYLDTSTSGGSKVEANDVAAVISAVETMATVASGLGAAWVYGGATDYPFLSGFDAGLQAVYFADFQTRIFYAAAGGNELPAGVRTELTSRENITLILDTNGEATAAPTPIPTCEADADGVIVAKTNYNNVTIRLRATGDGSAVFTNDCKIVISEAGEDPLNVSVDALIATGETTISGWSHSFNVNLNEAFLAKIATGDDWFASDLAVAPDGTRTDWDDDGIDNPYDWTPLPGINLTLHFTGEGGTADNPWPIYNVWQLQAIDGMSVSDAGKMAGGLTLFGDTATRLTANYLLARDIDATPTRRWNGGKGFNPIGFFDSDTGSVPLNFTGVFDGGGNVVRGLHIVSDSVNNGLFGIVSGGVVASLGLDDVFVSGENGSSHSGALAGSLMSGGAVRESWARGRVNGREAVGGLLGQATRGGGEPPSVSVSWFAGWVAADGDPTLFRRAGGLVGNPGVVGITDSWAAVSVAVSSDNPYAGELVGSVENETDLLRLWGEGVFSGVDSRDGSPASQISLVYYDNIRGLNRADDFDDAAIWDTGTDADYPVLTVHSRNLQGAAIAAGLSRVVGINGATAVTATRPIVTLGAEFAAIRIEKLTVETPDLACSFSDGALRAGMGFNAATVIITLIALDAELERRGDDDSCEANVINNSGGGVTLRILHVSRADAAAPEARLTTDYDLVIEVDLLASARKAREAFVAAITTDDFGWSSPALIIGSGTTLDWDDDGIANVYDWTPTSVTITLGGTEIEFEVNLTLDGVDPWPVFNVWQLQAIDGMSVSDVGKMTGGLELFGDTATRLGANYRLMMDIDATPTRGWDDGKGFNPIGTLDLDLDDGDDSEKFTGEFDGDDNVVRGLRIVRDTESNGLFGFVSGGVVENLGLDDVFVFGETGVRHSGALVGIMLGGKVRESWARGGVYGRLAVGGLVGSARPSEVGSEAPNVSASWFAGRVAVRGSLNDNLRVAGGLVGSPNVLEITDSWAAVDITVINTRSPRAGELVGNVGNILVSVSRSWGEGYSSGLTRPNPVESQVYYDNIRTLGRADDFGDAAIWDTGTDTDFPILNPPHSAATQGAAIAAGLSRVVGINDGASVVAARQAANTPLGKEFEAIRIEKVSADTPDLDCDFSDGALRAEVGYNMATVIITLIAFDARLRGAADSCEIDLVNNLGGDATLRFIYTSRVDPAAPEARLTTDYDLTIALDEAVLAPAARDAFVAAIATVAFGWSSPALIVGSGTSLDWDDDGIANPYDWTPTSVKIMAAGAKVEIEVNLTLSVGGANPWPIYNVWQLQAIDGMSVSEDGTLSGDLALFGADKDAGLTTQYRLEMDIDATRTRKWKDGDGKTVGFDPIGGDFTGGLDGNGKVVRGLFIDRTGDDIGLFSKIITDGGLAVSGLGVEEAEIRGGNGVGIIAGGATDSSFSEVWTTGKVVGSGQDIGGLIGVFSGNTNLAGTIMMSWSAADVEGNGGNVGGLTGLNHSDSVSVNLDDNWAAGDVRGSQDVGGFSGSSSGVIYNRNWSSGAVFGGLPSGGFAGSNVLGGDEYNFAYWNDDTRNVSTSGGGGVGVILQTLSSVSFGGAAAAAWDFGDSVLSNTDGVADFPLLKSSDRALQAVYLARALTRVLSAADSEEIAAGASIMANNTIRLDTNGLAPDTGTDGTSIPTCAIEDGELRANAELQRRVGQIDFDNGRKGSVVCRGG